MHLEFPYQLTTFLDVEPTIGEPVYNGKNGWYAQIALKRRFKVVDMTEGELLQKISDYCNATRSFAVETGDLIQPDRMPVKILAVGPSSELIGFHTNFISSMGDSIQSRYPERDGSNYLPHVTAEYDGKMVIEHAKFANRQFIITKIFLLKDLTNEDSIAYKSFHLRS